ncbi:MAG: cell envelope integrity EipB family protein [Alphaproteobacteria bacterium]|nr:cell envelope integrity EipB family protein [Alphaproteobacteria bacterium]
MSDNQEGLSSRNSWGFSVRLFAAYSFLLLLGLAGAAPALAAPSLVAGGTAQAASARTAKIAPHRAIYGMSLATVRNGANITDVSGRMLFEWRDVCDGWAIQQHMQLHFTYADGDDQDVTSTELTWEAKDGKSYSFNIRRLTNGKETENYRGKAVLNADGSGTVTYTEPKPKTVQLPAGTLFPSAHTQLILQKAAQGEKLFTKRVFDGSDEDGSSDISAFILPQKADTQKAGAADSALEAGLKANPLLADAGWPVHMAFFKIGTETGEPDYEMDLNLLPNGIARHMKIDYGDFAVTGNLEDVEALPAPSCHE